MLRSLVGDASGGGRIVVQRDEEAVVVRTAGHKWGVWVRDVVELLPMVSLTPLPAAPSVVEGVVNVRGEIVPVLPLRRRLDLPDVAPRPSDRLMLVDVGGRRLALRVDAVDDVVAVDAASLDEAVTADDRYTAGVARMEDGLLLVADLEAFLSTEEALVLDAALSSGEGP